MQTILMLAAGIAVLLLAIAFSIWATAGIRKNKRAFAVASALLLSFGFYNPSAEKIAEAREEDEYSKRQRAGDPPKP
jgi:H+/gluconate symporter-like permease